MSVKALLALFYYVTLLLYLFFFTFLKLSNILSIFNVCFFTSFNMLTTECNTNLTSVKSKTLSLLKVIFYCWQPVSTESTKTKYLIIYYMTIRHNIYLEKQSSISVSCVIKTSTQKSMGDLQVHKFIGDRHSE